MLIDSIKKRYFFKLLAGGVNLVASFVIHALIPRGLGITLYGAYSFINDFFLQVINFFDTGTAFGLHVKISQRPKDFGLINFYLIFLLFILVLLFGFVSLACLMGLDSKIWPDQPTYIIFYGLVFAILTMANQIANRILDAQGLTVPGEVKKIIQRSILSILMFLALISGLLTIHLVFVLQYLSLTWLTYEWYLILRRSGVYNNVFFIFNPLKLKKYIKEFYNYCHPLFVYTFVGAVFLILDRWVLQFFYGNQQQAYFGLAQVFSYFCLFFTTALTPIITREFAFNYSKSRWNVLRLLYYRGTTLFFFLSIFLAAFVSTHAKEVVALFAGDDFQNAYKVFIIYAMYPPLQTLGQVNGALFYATNRTRAYRNLGIIIFFIGFIFTYLLIFPRKYGGFQLGADGLAVKVIIVQIFSIGIMSYLNARYLRIRHYLIYQIIGVIVLLIIGCFSRIVVTSFTHSIITRFILSGCLYVFLSMVLVYVFPRILGFRKLTLTRIVTLLK